MEGIDRVAHARAAGVLRGLPRRPRLARASEEAETLRVRRVRTREAPLWYTLLRTVRWLSSLLVFKVKRTIDKMRGNVTDRQRGVRMRELFESMGGTAIKIGQQISVRVDFLPFAVCNELGKLVDAVPPFPIERARSAIERAAGRPMEEVYAQVEPTPIGSASIACVFRGRLHDGQQVAIKVRRPDIERQFMADLRVVSWLTLTLEHLTVVRPGFFKYLRSELRDMLMDELDFHKEASFQSMFRRYVKRDRIPWLTAPRVHAALSSSEVLVSRFVDAYPCQQLLRAVETNDVAALKALEEHDIDPSRVGYRIMQLSHWARLECAFFHCDPHPGNVLILPGNRIVMSDFGACGMPGTKQGEHYREMSRRIVNHDLSGAASVLLSSVAPLPNVDVAELQKRLEEALWSYHIIACSKDGKWWEQTTAALYIRMMEVIQQYNVPINIDVLRMTRALLLYDTLACRLNPDINSDNGYRNWIKAATRRADRRLRRRSRMARHRRVSALLQQLGSLGETARKGAFWVNALSSDLPREFAAVTSKSAFVASLVLRWFLLGLLLCLLSAAGAAIYFLVSRRQWLTVDLGMLSRIASHPLFLGLAGVVLFRLMWTIYQRLSALDPD